jgi:hypothetical protein
MVKLESVEFAGTFPAAVPSKGANQETTSDAANGSRQLQGYFPAQNRMLGAVGRSFAGFMYFGLNKLWRRSGGFQGIDESRVGQSKD